MFENFKRALAFVLTLLMVLNMTVFAASGSEEFAAKLYWTADAEQGTWMDVESADAGAIFNLAGFEPGSEEIRYLKVQNIGKRALSYALSFVSESEIGELANVIDVYYKGDITANATVSEMTKIGTLAEVINGTVFSTGNILPDALADDGFYTGNTNVAVAIKMQDNASGEYMNKSIADFSIKLTATECTYDNYPSVDKFELMFPNTDDYIYRVGNANAVKLSSLFKAIDGADIGNVTVQIEKLDSATDVTWVYTPATVWNAGTIQFSGTGPVKVTIDDDDFANALSLNLEVINATNLTSAASVTTNDAVLLNDANFSTFSVTNGHTLYGNGFTLTAPNDVPYHDWLYSFVDLQNGTLDNVKVICPNFSHQVLFSSNLTEEDNPWYKDANGNENKDLRYNARSAVKMTDSSKITNSYVSGGRVAVLVTSGNPVIENSTIYGGAAANIHVVSPQSVLLRDTILIQEPIQATVNDTSKTIMGISVFIDADASGASAPITLEGDFIQYAWACEEYAQYVPARAQQFVSNVLSKSSFKHQVTYKDGITRESLNLGFASIPGDLYYASIPNVIDNRTKKDTIPYIGDTISMAAVYSYGNSKGLDPSFATFPVYEAEKSANIPGTLTFSGSGDGISYLNTFDEGEGQQAKLTVDLDAIGSYNFSFDKLTVNKFGRNLSYVVKDADGNTVDKTAVIALTDTGTKDYVLEVTDDVFYGADGQLVSGSSETYSFNFSLVATKTSINPPTLVGEPAWENPLLVVKSKDSDWSCAVPASLSEITINYYSTDAKAYKDLNLGGIIPTSTGKQNGTNNYWEHNGGDYKLKITSGYIHEGKKVYGMPVVVNNGGNKMYFTISSTNGYVSTGTASRTVTLTYDFTDNNGNTISFSETWNVVRADLINAGAIQYSYSDFVNGTLTDTASSSGGGCFAEGTIITLADGSQKAIENLTFEDEILVWDFFEGEYTTSVPSLLLNDGVRNWDVITLNFSDGTALRTIYEHGLFDVDENDYVLINADNVDSFVGHKFIKTNGVENEIVTLESYDITSENVGCRTILTAQHNNCIANGILTVTPPPIDGFYDYFEIGEGMKYDAVAMEADIAKYGLYTYDDFKDYISYEEFIAFNGAYLKLPVEKGYFTFDDILEQISAFGVGASAIAALSEDEVATVTIIATGNSVTTADYAIAVSGEGFVAGENGYTVDADECNVVLTAGGASTGYAKVTVDGEVYYTNQIAKGESFALTIKNAKGKEFAVESFWGNSANYEVAQDTLISTGKVIEYTYTVAIEATNATEIEGGYAVTADEAVFTLTANGSATPGYAKITVNGDDYYTVAIAKGETFTFTVKNANGKVVAIETFYGEPTAENLLADGSTIGYVAEISATNATLGEDGKYVVNTDEATIKVAASGTSTGYAKITVGSDVYYTNQIAAGESFTLNLKNAKGEAVAVETVWSNSANDGIAQDTLIADGKVIEYTYTVAIEATNATEIEGGYAVTADEAVFTLTANGSATPGYAKITVNGDDYYTVAIAKGETFTFTVKNANGKVVAIETFYGEPTAEKLLADGSTIGYIAEVSATNATLGEDGKYVVNADEATIKVTASGTSTGYAKITVGGDVYYTNQIAAGESFTLNLKNAKGEAVAVETVWGNSASDGIAQDTLIADGKVIEYTFGVEISALSAEVSEVGYLCLTNEVEFVIAANGTAKKGYAILMVDGDVYYTGAIVPGETYSVTVKNAMGKAVKVEAYYGEVEGEIGEAYIVANNGIIDCGIFAIKSVVGTTIILSNTTKYESVACDIYVAVYDSTNRMVGIKAERNVKVEGKSEHKFDSELTIPEGGSAKAFVWSAGGAVPIF